MRRTPLRRVSEKRVIINRQRSEFVREQLDKRRVCEAGLKIGEYLTGMRGVRWPGCTYAATQLHEPKTRKRFPGSDTILDPENTVAICASCHIGWVHLNPRAAEEIGLLVRSGS